MILLNKKKDEIQNEVVKEFLKNNKVGTCEIITGFGKTFLFLKILNTFPKYKNDTIHLFLAEQKDRENDLLKDISKFNKIYNCDILKEYNLQFQCYQTVRNWKGFKFGLVCADEIHDSISPENCKFYFNNINEGLLGLTAKFDGKKIYDFSDDQFLIDIFGKIYVSKQEMLDLICPVIFKYDIEQAQIDNTSRKLNIFIFNHDLDKTNKNILAGSKNKPFYQTEEKMYNYLTEQFKKVINLEPFLNENLFDFEQRKNKQIINIINKRTKFLHTLPSRFKLIRELLKYINDKTIIFGNSIEELEKLTPNVISSKKTDDQNNEIRQLFDDNIIKIIASFKKLKQGANLEKVSNCIIHSYYSSEIDLIQRIGRLRQDGNKEGNVFIFVSNNTQEEVWLNTMLSNFSNLNIKYMKLEDFISNKLYINL